MLNGIIDFVLSAHPRAAALRRHFVFKIIPILNPDGVARGHYRSDSRGCNLNRFYTVPDPAIHPSVHGARQLVMQYHSAGLLLIYIDLHAHAGKKGCFFYGNALEGSAQVENFLFVKLAAMNCPHIDLEGSNFSSKNM
jgi:hypothetical protein